MIPAIIGALAVKGAEFLIDLVLRKWPGATPYFQGVDNFLDKVPGFKNIPTK